MSIGVICACMNREAMLRVSLSSWLNCKAIAKIIITDWSSKDPISNIEELDQRIKVLRVDGQNKFNLSKAYNTALKALDTELVLKLDVDYILNPYFDLIKDISVGEDEFLTGHWVLGQSDKEMGFLKYLNGFIYTYKSTLDSVNGYNENLEGYGFDDDDLYKRLKIKGFKRRVLLFDRKPYIYHNPHEDSTRSENYEEKDINLSLQANRLKSLDNNKQ